MRGEPATGRRPTGEPSTGLRTPLRLSTVLLVLMATQSALGLLFTSAYRDPVWVRAAWYGNDWVTLVVGVPLLSSALLIARRGSSRGKLLWLGMLGYAIYNYAFYLFGADLNAFFPLYVGALVTGAAALISALQRLSIVELSAAADSRLPNRLIGGYMVTLALGLTVVWLALWAGYAFGGRPTPVEPEAFKLVAALDLSLMAPVLAVAGVLLWRRRPWGIAVAAIAGVQSALYLFVLSVNSVAGILRGLTEQPGELPVWGPLTILTAAVVVLLLAHVRDAPVATDSEAAVEP